MNHRVHATFSLSTFDYFLPKVLIAQYPAEKRGESRLLHVDAYGERHDRLFSDLAQCLRPHDLLVFNDTRVIKARLHGQKSSGGKVEVLVERLVTPDRAWGHIRASHSPRPGSVLRLAQAFDVTVMGRQADLFDLQFPSDILKLLEIYGTLPLPGYITHPAQPEDEQRYQTVYARTPGAIAAPTAGLHFDVAMLQKLIKMGFEQAFVTLHVGAGTFQPVRVENIADHVMHSETYVVPAATQEAMARTRAAGGRIVAIGTTSARALESMAQNGPQGNTTLFITPGYRFKMVDALLTNFHLPQSTLLMLVSALAGIEPIRQAYAHAIRQQYRFFSYGDAMFIDAPIIL